MIVIADTHVHIYPCYDIEKALREAFGNMNRRTAEVGISSANETIIKILCLTERSDCAVFQALATKTIDLRGTAYAVRPVKEEEALLIERHDGDTLLVIAGRQVVTKERLEVLGLCTNCEIPDGRPAAEVIEMIAQAQGVPVLNWAPGKWFFERGRVVKDLIDQSKPDQFLLADMSLRPLVWPEPCLFRAGRKRGFRLIAGSDPLPFPGEELLIGSYVTCLQGSFDVERPVSSIRSLLLNSSSSPLLLGHRSGVFEMLNRLRKNEQVRRDEKKTC